jgi:hypothetical protein
MRVVDVLAIVVAAIVFACGVLDVSLVGDKTFADRVANIVMGAMVVVIVIDDTRRRRRWRV